MDSSDKYFYDDNDSSSERELDLSDSEDDAWSTVDEVSADEESPEEADTVQKIGILDFPAEILQKIFGYLSYHQVNISHYEFLVLLNKTYPIDIKLI